MKIYIFFTGDIHSVGGEQLYTAGKIGFLKKQGWTVYVFYTGNANRKCEWEVLDVYDSSGFPVLNICPNELPAKVIDKIYREIYKRISSDVEKASEILLESHSDITALWGEFFAKKINARHIVFNCNEIFRGKNKHYATNMGFFKFKYDRGELLGLHRNTHEKIFDGFFIPKDTSRFLFDAVEPEPVQDVKSGFVNNLQKADCTIAYIGRAEKGYVDNIIEGVMVFARNHPTMTINFIMVGDATLKKKKLDASVIKNLNIILPGDMIPIPKSLFAKTDIIIAGAVCAEISARENVPTIVADCENYLANGVLGYTTFNSMYHEPNCNQTDFATALEDTFIEKKYLKYTYSFTEANNPELEYMRHFSFFDLSNKDKKYYNVETPKKTFDKNFKNYMFIFSLYMPSVYYILLYIWKRLKYEWQK